MSDDDLLKLYYSGLSCQEIGKQVFLCREAVRKRLRNLGAKKEICLQARDKQKLPDHELVERYHAGESYEAIGKDFGYTAQGIRYRLLKLEADSNIAKQARIQRKIDAIKQYIEENNVTKFRQLRKGFLDWDPNYLWTFCKRHGIRYKGSETE